MTPTSFITIENVLQCLPFTASHGNNTLEVFYFDSGKYLDFYWEVYKTNKSSFALCHKNVWHCSRIGKKRVACGQLESMNSMPIVSSSSDSPSSL